MIFFEFLKVCSVGYSREHGIFGRYPQTIPERVQEKIGMVSQGVDPCPEQSGTARNGICRYNTMFFASSSTGIPCHVARVSGHVKKRALN